MVTLKEIQNCDLYIPPYRIHNKAPVTADIVSIPKRYTGKDNWPMTTNLLCWYCSLLPMSQPKFIPHSIHVESDGRIESDAHGNFCTWNCAVAFIHREYPVKLQGVLIHNILVVASDMEGEKIEMIAPSPSKTCMKQYCGCYGCSEEEYRERIDNINKLMSRSKSTS